jgi:hypothetical protein
MRVVEFATDGTAQIQRLIIGQQLTGLDGFR